MGKSSSDSKLGSGFRRILLERLLDNQKIRSIEKSKDKLKLHGYKEKIANLKKTVKKLKEVNQA